MRHTGSKGIKGLSLFAVTCISIITLLSIIGVGYGYWQNGIEVANSISTGNMKISISDCKLYEKKENKNKDNNKDKDKSNGNAAPTVKLNIDNKKMNVEIKDAYPGYAVAIQYTITNNGSIPVKCKLIKAYYADEDKNNKDPEKSLKHKDVDECTVPLGVGESKKVITIININKVDKEKGFSASINLDFDQYNELD